MGDVVSDDVIFVCDRLLDHLCFCLYLVDLSSILGRGNVIGTMFSSMQSLHDNIISWLSFSATRAVARIVVLRWLILRVTCPIIFILAPLALTMSAFFAALMGSPCALSILCLIIVVVELVSGSGRNLSRAFPASSHYLTSGVGPQL